MNPIPPQAPPLPPPPPPGTDVIQLPVSGLTLEVTHAETRNSLLESIRQAGGFTQAKLKHIPEDHQHLPGKPRPPPTAYPVPTGSGTQKNKMAAGKTDLMNDLNAALHNRKMGRGMGKKQFICHVPLVGQGKETGRISLQKKTKEPEHHEISESTDF